MDKASPSLDYFGLGGPVHQGAVLACAFLGGPELLATGSVDGRIVIWDVTEGRPLRRYQAHQGAITALAWDAPRRRLISGGHDRRIAASHPGSEAPVETLAEHDAGLFALAISADGSLLASGGYDRVIRLWRLADGAPVGVMEGHGKAVTDLDFIDARRLASCGRDCQVIVWDLGRQVELLRTEGHRRWAMRVRASADGGALYSAGEDGFIHAWSADSGERLASLRLASPIWGLERTAAGDALLAGAGGALMRIDLAADSQLEAQRLGSETCRAIARCEAGLMAMGADSDKVLLYRPGAPEADEAGETLRRLETRAPMTASLAAVQRPPEAGRAQGLSAMITRYDGGVCIDRGGERRPLVPVHAGLAFAACTIDEHLFATSGFDGKIHLRRSSDGALVESLDHQGFIFSLTPSADGRRLLSAGHDRLNLWDVTTGDHLWGGHDLGIGFHCWGALSEDGGLAVAVGEGRMLHRWNFLDTDIVRGAVKLDFGHVIGTCGLMAVAILDEQSVAVGTAEGEVRRADLASGRSTLLHAVHESGVRALHLSPDHRRLLSYSENATAAVYDLGAGKLCTPREMAEAAVPAAAFTRSGDLVWIDGEAVLHALKPEALEPR